MVGQAHPPEYHALSLNHHMKVKEGWSRVPARDAIGLLVRLSTARNRGQSAVVFMAGQHRHGGVVAVQAVRRQNMLRYQVVQRSERHRAGAHLVGQGRQAVGTRTPTTATRFARIRCSSSPSAGRR